jgi:predicted nuclease of predicted toxin-antitoxin system
VRCLIDAQLPPALARWLTSVGHEATHVFDLRMASATDAVIWQHAIETGSVIVSKDEDFAVRAQLRKHGPTVVWVRYGNVRRAELIRQFQQALPAIVDGVARGEHLIELT